ncbi:hypothetical protein ABDH65_15900 [Heyndrickxia ginsengihumi]
MKNIPLEIILKMTIDFFLVLMPKNIAIKNPISMIKYSIIPTHKPVLGPWAKKITIAAIIKIVCKINGRASFLILFLKIKNICHTKKAETKPTSLKQLKIIFPFKTIFVFCLFP